MEFIALKNISKEYKAGKSTFTALHNISLTLEKGSFTVIKGASGSGKSTMLNLLAGIDYPTAGEIWIDNTAIQNLSSNSLAKWRGKNLGIVFQFFQLMPTLTVIENVILPMEFVKMFPKSEHKKIAENLLKKLNILELADKFPNTLSGGEKQRVAIARALANSPEIIIADEPTGNLDSVNSKIIHDVFKQLNAEGKTILYVTHEQTLPEGHTHLVELKDGKINRNTMSLS